MNDINVLPHNKRASKKVQEKFKDDNLAAVVHATGTGKNFIFLDIALENPDKKFMFLAPSMGIIEHINEILLENNLNLKNVEFRTYQSLINLSKEELEKLDIDYLILDEFHHIGAPIWGNRIKNIIDTHPNLKTLGMSAYTVRNRGRENENDLTSPLTDELFSGQVVSTYALSTAIVDKVLPLPTYKTAYVTYDEVLASLKSKFNKLKKESVVYREVQSIISRIEQKIQHAKNMGDLFKENIKPNGKYIYFCPINKSGNPENSIEAIQANVKKWLAEMGLSEDDYVFYETTDEMGSQGKKNRDAFYHDEDLNGNPTDKKLRIMFAINQYNEGVHAPNVDGVIMGRDTKSDIVFYEQFGRALSVIGEDALILDLAGNIEFMYYLQDQINREVKRKNARKLKDHPDEEELPLEDFEFNIGLMNVDILNLIKECEARLGMGFYDNYDLAKKYYEHYGNLLIPAHFNTFDGVTTNAEGIQLGQWIRTIRKSYKDNKLTPDKIDLLDQIDMVWENIDIEENWMKNYELASAFYRFYGNLEIPSRFRTKNGFTYDANGVNLGTWIKTQRAAYSGKTAHKITPIKIKLLDAIGMRWGKIDRIAVWKSKYIYAKEFFLKHGNLEVPDNYSCMGGFNLKVWLKNQKSNFDNLNDEQIDLLEDIKFNFEKKDYVAMWSYKYSIYKRFVEYYKRNDVPSGFRTLDGVNYADNGIFLDVWYNYQFKRFQKGILDDTQREMLEDLGVEFDRVR